MVYLRNLDPAPPVRYKTMNTLRPFGVILMPKPGQPASQYTMSDFEVGSASIALLVSRMRGMAGGTCPAVLPSHHIGSTANEMTGLNVIRRPHSRKKNQGVMNHQPPTSISGKHHPENARGEGTITATAAVDLTLGGMVQRDCVLPAGPLTSSSAPPRRAPAPRPPLLRPWRRRRYGWPRPRADSRVPGASEGGFLGGRRLAPRGGGEPAV